MASLKCPRCPGQLVAETYEGVTIDRCPACGGAWLDTGEIEHIVNARDQEFAPGEISETLRKAQPGISDPENKSVELCPHCSVAMTPMNYNYSSGIIIDVCPAGHGLWFDKKELQRSEMHFEHWQDKLPELKLSWGEMLGKVEAGEKARMSAEDQMMSNRRGILSRGIDAFLYWSKLNRG